jgi:hypothetical protein
MLSLNQVKESLPPGNRNNVTQDMVNQLNALSKDPEEARYIRENFISFSQVLMEGRFRLGDYVQAVMYVSYKVMGKNNIDAYRLTFPDRHAAMIASGKVQKDIASMVTAYNKGVLVTKIMERAIIPTWILNQDMFQAALQTQFEIMTDPDINSRDRTAAANSLLTHLKKPEVHKSELKIDIAVNDGMASLEKQLRDLSQKQLNLIEHDPNITAGDIAAMPMRVINS